MIGPTHTISTPAEGQRESSTSTLKAVLDVKVDNRGKTGWFVQFLDSECKFSLAFAASPKHVNQDVEN